MSDFLRLPNDDSYCISNTLVAEPQSGNGTVRVYNVLDGEIKTKPYVEINGVPRKPYKGFECKVRGVVKKTGFCKSDDMLKKSFFTPLDNGKKSEKFDSSVLLRLTSNYFMFCLLNCKERKVGVVYLEDLHYDCKSMEAFQVVNMEEVSFVGFKKRIQEMVDWRKGLMALQKKMNIK